MSSRAPFLRTFLIFVLKDIGAVPVVFNKVPSIKASFSFIYSDASLSSTFPETPYLIRNGRNRKCPYTNAAYRFIFFCGYTGFFLHKSFLG
jgi:hypothetical protein